MTFWSGVRTPRSLPDSIWMGRGVVGLGGGGCGEERESAERGAEARAGCLRPTSGGDAGSPIGMHWRTVCSHAKEPSGPRLRCDQDRSDDGVCLPGCSKVVDEAGGADVGGDGEEGAAEVSARGRRVSGSTTAA